MKFVRILLLSLVSVSLFPEVLSTGCLLPQDYLESAHPSSLVLMDRARPESRIWSLYSDIVGDLGSGLDNVSRISRDDGHLRSAAELGYENQLSALTAFEGEGTNILLLGIDRRTAREVGRSDVMVLLRVIPKEGILLLSIPRDTRVPLNPGIPFGYRDKIAHMYVYGGVERTKASVENLLGVKVDHYVVVENLSNFRKLLSIVRGVDVDKHLEGDLGLKWIRNRRFIHGDFERAMRAQLFLKAALKKAWTLTDAGDTRLTRLLARGCLLFVNTDLTVTDIAELSEGLRTGGFDPETDIHTGHLTGTPALEYSPALNAVLSYVDPNPQQLAHLSGLFAGSGLEASRARDREVHD
jgi:hypothetical protein